MIYIIVYKTALVDVTYIRAIITDIIDEHSMSIFNLTLVKSINVLML